MSSLSRISNYFKLLRFTPFDITTEVGRSKERYRLIVISGISGLAAKLIIALIGLVSVPLTIHYLGKEQFGLWMVVSSLVIWMQIADFGIGNGLTNALAEAHGRDDHGAANGYFSASIAATLVMALFCFAIIYSLSLWLPWNIIINLHKDDLAPLAAQCFLAAGMVFVVNIPLSVASRALIAYQCGYLASATQILSAFASLAGLFVAIMMKLDLFWLVVLSSSGQLIGHLLAFGILLKILPWLRFHRKFITGQALRRIADSSIPLFIFQIGALSVNQLVNIVIVQVGTLEMVADYNVVLKIYILVFTVGISISAPFYPAIREAYEKHEAIWVMNALNRVLFVRLAVLLPAGICLLFTGDLIIQLWIHMPIESRFGFMGWLAFLLSLLFAATSSTLGEILTSLDDIWPQIKIVFLSAVVVLTSMVILIPKIGLAGVFFAMAISTLYPILWSWRKLKSGLETHFS